MSDIKITVNFASRSRYSAARNSLDGLLKLAEDPASIAVHLSCDLDEQLPYGLLFIDYNEYFGFVDVQRHENRSKIEAINRIPPVEGSIVVNWSDDMRMQRLGWDMIVRDACDFNYFVHFPCDVEGGEIALLNCTRYDYWKKRGYIYHPDYFSLWCDNEETERAKAEGKYEFVPIRLFEHLHYSNGKADLDLLYKRNRTYRADKEVYEKRKALNFPVESVWENNER